MSTNRDDFLQRIYQRGDRLRARRHRLLGATAGVVLISGLVIAVITVPTRGRAQVHAADEATTTTTPAATTTTSPSQPAATVTTSTTIPPVLGWSIVPTPNVATSPSQDSLSAVSCIDATFCVAVGPDPREIDIGPTFVETWDGRSWSIVPSPSPEVNATLHGVSCTSRSFCMSVGMYRVGPPYRVRLLAESWDGTSWSIVPTPSSADQDVSFAAVSCTSPSFCIAAGDIGDYGNSQSQPLIASWDGTSWSIAPVFGPYADSATFNAVSCTSPAFCVAVGSHQASSNSALIESWDGSTWSIVASGNHEALYGVSCASTSFCIAVGESNAIESWDGTSWSIAPTPSPVPGGIIELRGVSCTGPSFCIAVGFQQGAEGESTRTESWDGTTWSSTPSQKVPNASGPGLNGVSCTLDSACMAVGYYFVRDPQTTFANPQALAERRA